MPLVPSFKKDKIVEVEKPTTLEEAAKKTPAAEQELTEGGGPPDAPPTVMHQLASASRAIAAAQGALMEAQETLNSIKTEALQIRQKI